MKNRFKNISYEEELIKMMIFLSNVRRMFYLMGLWSSGVSQSSKEIEEVQE
jgi:hypothetical protein